MGRLVSGNGVSFDIQHSTFDISRRPASRRVRGAVFSCSVGVPKAHEQLSPLSGPVGAIDMPKTWDADEVLKAMWGFRAPSVLGAAAELDVFGALGGEAKTAADLAAACDADLRGMTALLDALTALEFLRKDADVYTAMPGVAETLTDEGADSVVAMVRHATVCLRRWGELAQVVRSGERASRPPSIRGEQGDLESFIEAMDNISRQFARPVIQSIGLPAFTHLLDVGGGPATWTIEFLRAVPEGTATLFDLPDVIPIARKHVEQAGLTDRVTFAPGSFETDDLPTGADLAWVSAIVHMNSRAENRDLFAKVHSALANGGRILIRDVVMDPSHTSPPRGALFAINMLVNTPGGGTFTFDELREDLEAAGFAGVELLREDEHMNGVVAATKA